jgi:hypothetical protein
VNVDRQFTDHQNSKSCVKVFLPGLLLIRKQNGRGAEDRLNCSLRQGRRQAGFQRRRGEAGFGYSMYLPLGDILLLSGVGANFSCGNANGGQFRVKLMCQVMLAMKIYKMWKLCVNYFPRTRQMQRRNNNVAYK